MDTQDNYQDRNETMHEEVPSFCAECHSHHCGACDWTLGNLEPDSDWLD